jgi:hypothetical protein
MQVEQQPTQTFRRNSFEILGECFSIYGRHFRKFILIALIVQAPLAVLGFAISDSLPTAEDLQRLQATIVGDPGLALPESAEPSAEPLDLPEPLSREEITGLAFAMAGYLMITLVLQSFLSGVISYAVGMQYATGWVDVGRCYSRAWWRVLTLVALGLLFFGLIVLMTMGFALLIVPGIIITVLIIYWSADIPVVAIEGCKPIAALKRSFELVRGNWWRTFSTILLTILVVMGLTIVMSVLLAAPMTLIGDEGLTGTTARVTSALSGMLSNAIIAPIAATAGTLIYLDLRSRKEDYDLEALSEQLGILPPDSTLA